MDWQQNPNWIFLRLDMNSSLHSTAIVESQSSLGDGVSVGPYAVIEEGAVVGNGSIVEAHAIIKKWARIGENVRVGHFSVIGGDPQHSDFDCQTKSFVSVGCNSRIGEGVTIHRSIYENQLTSVGDKVFLMGNSHVAHDSILGDRVVLANGALLGGHVEIGADVFVGGGTAVHQFVRIGCGAMIGGLAEISQDVGPHLLVTGRNHASGINVIGLSRRNASKDDINCLKRLYRDLLYSTKNVIKCAKEHINELDEDSSSIVREFLHFFITGDRGFARNQKCN